jgi:hypothetical protein
MKLLVSKQLQTSFWRAIGASICCTALLSCATTDAPQSQKSQDVSVAELRPSAETGIKRQQLEVEIRRYADTYAAVMSLEADRIMDRAGTPELRWFATGWKLTSRATVVDIAVGPNAVENLLDMLVLTALTRQELEEYWVPKVLGPKLGAGLLNASIRLENEAWERSRSVLTAAQQADLRELIREWNEAHPDQHYFWEIRFGGFSGQRAKDLEQVGQTGGLLGEVAQTRQTVDEVREFSERLLYYLQRAPTITRLEAEFGMRTMLRTPELQQLLNNTERLTRSAEAYADLARNFPAEREAAFTQLIELERDAIRELLKSEELNRTMGKISDEGGDIANLAFIRGALLILLWFFAYVGAKLTYDYLTRKPRK